MAKRFTFVLSNLRSVTVEGVRVEPGDKTYAVYDADGDQVAEFQRSLVDAWHVEPPPPDIDRNIYGDD